MRPKAYCAYLSFFDLRLWGAFADVYLSGQSDEKSPPVFSSQAGLYFVLVIGVLLIEFSAGTLGFIYRRHAGAVLQEELLTGLQTRYTTDNENGLKTTWDHIQEQVNTVDIPFIAILMGFSFV
ncbi:tetraspanin [Trichonephila clavipes]|nr:tetraspanin [Trichonephila clavipes]